jgi:hypothetical protein
MIFCLPQSHPPFLVTIRSRLSIPPVTFPPPTPEGKCARSSRLFSYECALPALPKRLPQVIVFGVVLSAVAGSLLAA